MLCWDGMNGPHMLSRNVCTTTLRQNCTRVKLLDGPCTGASSEIRMKLIPSKNSPIDPLNTIYIVSKYHKLVKRRPLRTQGKY